MKNKQLKRHSTIHINRNITQHRSVHPLDAIQTVLLKGYTGTESVQGEMAQEHNTFKFSP